MNLWQQMLELSSQPDAKPVVKPGSSSTPEIVTIEGDVARAISPEGRASILPVPKLLSRISPKRIDTGDLVLPDGIKGVYSEGPATLWVHQTPPRVYGFQWIADDSPSNYGKGTKYREVRIALPYLVTFALFLPGPGGRLQISHANECFFRTAPLDTLDDPLLYPGLLNCSKFDPQEGHPLSWICTQHLKNIRYPKNADGNVRMRTGFRALMHCLLETGFNYSSEHHEGASWFTESRDRDPRIATVEQWQEETGKDRFFVLDVPWIEVGLSVSEVTARIFALQKSSSRRPIDAGGIARLIFNHGTPCPDKRKR